jgi:hypothetical protein
MNPSNKIERKLKINSTNDPSSIQAVTYNHQTGAQKNMEMGRHLIPIPTSPTTFTTDVTSATALPSKGITLAIYNASSTAYAITLGDSTVTALGIGVTNASGNVGIPCTPNDWTYIATFDKTHVISNSSNLKVMIVADSTVINSQ